MIGVELLTIGEKRDKRVLCAEKKIKYGLKLLLMETEVAYIQTSVGEKAEHWQIDIVIL